MTLLKTKKENQKDFYQQTADWAYDMYQSQTLWLRRVLLILMMVMGMLMLSLLSNLYLFPLKEKVPYLYAFDHATGEITKIGALEATPLSSNWALSRFFLIRYVINAESYDADNMEHPYQLVWAQSANRVKTQYEEKMGSDNPSSPYKQYGKDKYVTVRVTSVNRLNENTVDVKFEKTLHDRSSHTEQSIQKEAIIKWTYETADTSQKMLDRDPLGFKVTYYQVSQVM